MDDSSKLIQVMMLNTLGLSILAHTMAKAQKYFYLNCNPNGRSETARCYAWIQGSGLDALLIKYNLDYDAETLRDSFNYFLKRKQIVNSRAKQQEKFRAENLSDHLSPQGDIDPPSPEYPLTL